MKKILFAFFLVFSASTISAQTFTEELKLAFQRDDFEALSKEIALKKLSFDDCFEIESGEKPYSLLELSAKFDNMKILKGLISKKADINKMCYDKTALMSASKYGRIEIVKELLKLGADKKIKNDKDRDALYYAERGEFKDIIELLK